MRRVLAPALIAALPLPAAHATDLGASRQMSQPGVCGRSDIGRFPQPLVIVPQLMIIERPPVVIAPPQPIYMRGAARASTKLAQILPAANKTCVGRPCTLRGMTGMTSTCVTAADDDDEAVVGAAANGRGNTGMDLARRTLNRSAASITKRSSASDDPHGGAAVFAASDRSKLIKAQGGFAAPHRLPWKRNPKMRLRARLIIYIFRRCSATSSRPGSVRCTQRAESASSRWEHCGCFGRMRSC
jgi:hypothetical protein